MTKACSFQETMRYNTENCPYTLIFQKKKKKLKYFHRHKIVIVDYEARIVSSTLVDQKCDGALVQKA